MESNYTKEFQGKLTRSIIIFVVIILLLIGLSFVEKFDLQGKDKLIPLIILLIIAGISFVLMDMRCPKCGAYLIRNMSSKYCYKCGVKLSERN